MHYLHVLHSSDDSRHDFDRPARQLLHLSIGLYHGSNQRCVLSAYILVNDSDVTEEPRDLL